MEISFFIGKSPKGISTALPDSRTGGRELSARILAAIANANESLEQATSKLIRLAEIAIGRRDYEALKFISDALQAIPFAPARRAATYYQAVLVKRAGQLDKAADLLATVHAPRALHSLASIEESRGNFGEASRLHVEAIRAARGVDLFTVASASMQLAAIRSFDGDHAGSLDAFHVLWPVVRITAQHHPQLFAAWHNAVAVELSELGRIDEARRAIAIAQASPLANRYPEIAETAREIAEASPARAAVVVVAPQEAVETTEAGALPRIVRREPPRRRFTFQPNARTLVNPRASPRAPPALF